ncbi:Methionine ABC transporter ATP-binding protein, partial [Salmonella enterica subsp. enterica serovar Minnesota str. A4-603]
LKILFIGDSAEQPVLSEVAITFGVAVNILHGKIEYIGERALGILVVQLTAPHNPTAVAAAWPPPWSISVCRWPPPWSISVNVPHRWR